MRVVIQCRVCVVVLVASVLQIYRYATGILIVLILFRGGMVWWYYEWYLIL